MLNCGLCWLNLSPAYCFWPSKIYLFVILLDKKISPKGANDIKLINAGKILENNKTVGQCRVPFGELPRGIITMHVVVQPSVAKAKTGRFHPQLII